MEKSVGKATRKKWEGLDDCLHVIDHKCPFGIGHRYYDACILCISLATHYRIGAVFTRPIPNPEELSPGEESDWFESVVKHAAEYAKQNP